MKVNEAIEKFKENAAYRMKPVSLQTYHYFFKLFAEEFGEREVEELHAEEIRIFLDRVTSQKKQNTKHARFTQLKALFNYCASILKIAVENPCKDVIIRKAYRMARLPQRSILSKEVIDELIYKAPRMRDRLIIELQAKSGLRIGEVVRLKVSDLDGRKLTLRNPKSGQESEVAFLPTSLAERLQAYIQENNLQDSDSMFGVTHSGARYIVRCVGEKVGIRVRPHDLRRHSATYASRNGVPLEVISKVILRHQDLKTTQVYLGKISEKEALRWMENLHGQ